MSNMSDGNDVEVACLDYVGCMTIERVIVYYVMDACLLLLC